MAACLALAGPAAAAPHRVAAGESIQAALDAAQPGDTVRVAAGTFHENLSITEDGTGTDNDFARNECETSQPAGLCG